MTKGRWLFLLLCIYLGAGAAITCHLIQSVHISETDTAAINHIVKDTEERWSKQSFSKAKNSPYEYTIIDLAGSILYQTSEQAPKSIYETVQLHGTILDIEQDHIISGRVLINTGIQKLLAKVKQQLILVMAIMLFAFLFPILIYIGYLNHSIQKPFLKLKDFARHIAMGNLDFPLPMDHSHIFGAFTESFDIMREQLKEARQREADANRSKKELVASLSHDIKTPVASIQLISELLLVTEPEGPHRMKIQTIHEKAGQIDHLISNMLHASLEDLGELKVKIEEENSTLLNTMIHRSDYYGRVSLQPIPDCLLLIDSLRMEQVIDNIIHNAYKYADTSILITSELLEKGLRIEFKDYGKGVPDEELPFLFKRYYRASNSQLSKNEGSGLGLFIAHYFMEKMGGSIQCFNWEQGFCVELFIRLTGPDSVSCYFDE